MIKNYVITAQLLVLFSIVALAQPACTDNRYVDDLYTVQVTQEPAVFATVDALVFPWLIEGWTFSKDLSFDFYEPQGDALTKRPLIIMSFGGAFLAGSKRQGELIDYCEAMAKKGYCVASIDYRIGFNALSGDSAIRAVYRGMQDFKAAVRYFRANAAMYNVDANVIYAGGNSAGSINAIHAAYTDESDRTAGGILGPTFNNPDLGCVNCEGSYPSLSSKPTALVNLWGGIGDLSWIEAGEAPINSYHGDNDTTVDPNSGAPFGADGLFPVLHGSIPIHVEAVADGIYNKLHVFAGGGHELWEDAAHAEYIQDSSSYFLHSILKPVTPTINGTMAICENTSATYCVNGAAATSDFCWSVTNGMIINDNNSCITVSWPTVGTGMIDVIERNCWEALSDLSSTPVVINASPVASFTSAYVGNGINFTDSSTGATSYQWDFGDGNTSAIANPSHTYITNGSYTATLTVINAQGCQSTFASTLHQNCQSNMTIATNPTPSGLYQVADWIYTDKILNLGSTVDFKAGTMITLESGFEVNQGDDFLAEIVGCSN